MSAPPRQQGITPQEPELDPSTESVGADEVPWKRRLANLSSQIGQGAAARVSTAYSAISSKLAGQVCTRRNHNTTLPPAACSPSLAPCPCAADMHWHTADTAHQRPGM